MGGGGVMRAVGKVAGVGIVNSGLRGGVQGTPLSAEQSVMRVAASSRSASSVVSVSSEGVSSVVDTTASVSHKSSWEMVDDWEFAGDFEQEAALEGSIAASGRPEPIARVLFSGVPSLEEAKEATNDLKDALDKNRDLVQHSLRSASSVVSVSSEGVSSVVDTTASVSHKSSWEMVDDWEFAGDFEQEAALEGSIAASGRPEPIARVLFSGVPSLEEAKEATNDLKDALDKVYLSSPKYSETVQVTGVSSLSNTEETKDCVAYNIEATSVPKPAIQAFKLLNESPAVQVVVNYSLDNDIPYRLLTVLFRVISFDTLYLDLLLGFGHDKFEFPGSPRSSVSSVKLEENEDSGDSFSAFIQKIKTSVVEMVSKTTDFLHSLFSLPLADKAKENAGSNNMDKTIGASLMGLAVMVIMVVLLKRV
ncbi:hypothetical protein GOBAR_AA10019 [Gossypium barbadense]|uniref:Uncharacterized protein n=1 Tax=Gossypium barbadense TaxID=3634 RepID=A0A2P5Y4V5_GOSBA|nr:hypothetical protein GOBAR_AA10019 [Gossypium barbadense]